MAGPQLISSLLMMLVIRSVDTTDPDVVFKIKLAYAAVFALVVGGVGAVYLKISAAANQTPLTVTRKPPGSAKEETEVMAIEAYDKQETLTFLTQKVLLPFAIMGFVYYKWEAVVPLLVQCFMMPKQLYELQTFQIFILGRAAQGELARPWAVANPLPSWLAPAAPKEEEKQIQKKK